jgi:hypothetical protein
MPKILDDAVTKIKARGVPESNAYAIATASLQKAGDLKAGSNQPTKQGVARGQMTEAQRHARPPGSSLGKTLAAIARRS